MFRISTIYLLGLMLLATTFVFAQDEVVEDVVEEEPPIGYQIKYDDPYDLKKLFVAFQPLYGEVASTNMTIGWGIQGDYYLNTKFDFSLHFRKSYSKRSDLMRYSAEKNSRPSKRAGAPFKAGVQ